MSVIVSLMGGLGFFLYGMKLMSEGLQKVAGSKMRSILEVFTKNRVIGLLVGIFFTALIQSSNATTVMVVSFVNSGLMKLAQAPGIILGANIGTTVTGQLIAFDLADIAPLFVIIGVLMVMFVKNNLTISRLGEVILGFGILFMGISGISGALNEAKEIPAVVNALGSLTNPFLAFLVGWVATAILQSNSATVGIIMLLAREGLMGLPICLFMMLGCNIGCTMSAILASFGCKKDAKRAACVHLLFNISGTIVCSIIFLLFGKQVVDFFMGISGNEAGRMIANANSIIKVCQVSVPLNSQRMQHPYLDGFILLYDFVGPICIVDEPVPFIVPCVLFENRKVACGCFYSSRPRYKRICHIQLPSNLTSLHSTANCFVVLPSSPTIGAMSTRSPAFQVSVSISTSV